jgi:hypothetical protein
MLKYYTRTVFFQWLLLYLHGGKGMRESIAAA